VADPLGRAFPQGLDRLFGGKDDDGDVDATGKFGDGARHREPQDFPAPRIDGVDLPLITVGQDVRYNDVARFSLDGRCADDGDLPGLEEGGQCMAHENISYVGC